jgi:hypothetical protein
MHLVKLPLRSAWIFPWKTPQIAGGNPCYSGGKDSRFLEKKTAITGKIPAITGKSYKNPSDHDSWGESRELNLNLFCWQVKQGPRLPTLRMKKIIYRVGTFVV